jgi:hypothetical protein
MLFPYIYVPHKMEKMQEFIDFIFYDVWCKAPAGEVFGFDLFNCKPELREVIVAFHYSDGKGADFFNGHVQKIYNLFKYLPVGDIQKFKQWYESNNNIQEACADPSNLHLVRYVELVTEFKDITEELAKFFKGLYSSNLLTLVALEEKIGHIDEHYESFMSVNKQGKCPFCGYNDVKGVYHEKREAYDHYLPKDKYPFNTINFYNLIPTCHECNSTYKLAKDPAHITKDPLSAARKVFYPFNENEYQIDIGLELKTTDWTNIKPDEIDIAFGPIELDEEIKTWLDVYDIDNRYKAKCCGENDGKGWLREVIDDSGNYGLTPSKFLEAKLKTAKKDLWVDVNFLKAPFLEACDRKGLFTEG